VAARQRFAACNCDRWGVSGGFFQKIHDDNN
jgi:hypothetical protein